MQYKMYTYPIKFPIITIILLVLALFLAPNPLTFLTCNSVEKICIIAVYVGFICMLLRTIKELIRFKVVRACIEENEFIQGKVIGRDKLKNGKTYYRAVCSYKDSEGKEYFFRSDFYLSSAYPFEKDCIVPIFVNINNNASLYYGYPSKIIGNEIIVSENN